MSNFQQHIQRVFKGENDIDQPSLLGEDEVVEAVNLIPFKDSRGLVLREGFATLYDTTYDNVLAVFNKRLIGGTLVTLVAAVDSSTNTVKVLKSSDAFASAATQIAEHSYSANTPGFWFADWDGDRVFWSDGVNGLWTYDFVNAAAQVTDKQTAASVTGWTASDTFTYADGAIPSPWTVRQGTITIVSNEASRTAGSSTVAIAAHTTNTCETAWEAEVGAPSTGSLVYSGVAGQIQADGDCYVWTHWGTAPRLRLCYHSANSLTTLASYDNGSAISASKLKMVRAGDQLVGYNWEGGAWVERARATLSTPLTDGNPGIFIGTIYAEVDNFAASSSTDPGNAAPSMRYIVNHRGRLFGASGTDDTVYFCGTDDTSSNRWENWSFGSYTGTNTIIDDGGSMKIAPYGRNTRGLASSKSGLLVFKEGCIVAWDWEDSAAPWEVGQGARTTVISSGVSLANHEALTSDGFGFVFVGHDATKNLSVYRFSEDGVEPISTAIPNKLESLSPDYDMHCTISGGILFVVARPVSGASSVQLMYNINSGGWFTVEAPDVQCTSHGVAGAYSIFGSGGLLLKYPSGVHYDLTDTPIDFRLKLAAFDFGKPFDDKLFRVFWFEGGSEDSFDVTTKFYGVNEGGTFTEVASPVSLQTFAQYKWGATSPDTPVDPVPSNLKWDEGFLWDSTGDAVVRYIPLGRRCLSMQPEISGSTSGSMFINNTGIAYRPRKPRSI